MKHEPVTYPEDVKLLLSMLTYKRPAYSQGDEDFIEKFILPYNPEELLDDNYQSLAYVITTDRTSRTLFTCHTDTVHRTSGVQTITYDDNCQLIYKSQDNDGECLGADDGAGCWMLLQMIEACVPGTYVFFRSEERGGIGSSRAADRYPDFFKGFDRAIAFDRRSTHDVITHQAGGRCCSDAFGTALASALNGVETVLLSYKADSTGIFTDTANLTELIPECTNLSCGYDAEHTNHETLDVEHLLALRDAALAVDWEALPTERDPSIRDDPWADYSYHYSSGNGSRRFIYEETEKVSQMTYTQLKAWVRKNSIEEIAEIISDLVDKLVEAEDAAYQAHEPQIDFEMEENWRENG